MKRVLLAAAFLTLVHSGVAQAQTPGGFRVFDSTGKLLGNFLAVMPCRAGSECGSAVVLIAGGITAALPVSSDGFVVPEFYFTHQPKFFHTSSDCSGQRFMGIEATDKSGLLPPVAIFSGGKLMIPLAPAVQTLMQSFETFGNSPADTPYTVPGSCITTSTTDKMFYVVTVDPLVIGTSPFSIR